MAKLYASEAACRICDEGVQIHGGYGFIKDYPAEKFYRDVKLCTIGEVRANFNAWSSPGAAAEAALNRFLYVNFIGECEDDPPPAKMTDGGSTKWAVEVGCGSVSMWRYED